MINFLSTFRIVLPQIVEFNFGNYEINTYDMVSATCTVHKGDLPMNIYWVKTETDHKHGYKVQTNDGIVISRNSPRISMLSIESVRDRHRGNYTCVVENGAGVAKYSAELKLNGTKQKNTNKILLLNGILQFSLFSPIALTLFCIFLSCLLLKSFLYIYHTYKKSSTTNTRIFVWRRYFK